MMKILRSAAAAAVLLASTGCYHAVIETGRAQSGDVLENKWVNSWLWGLVPPDTVETASKCPGGVAKVETQHSFVNQVAAAVTLGIYTPMQITVTCASSGSGEDAGAADAQPIDLAAPIEVQREALSRAIRRSIESGHAQYVRFE